MPVKTNYKILLFSFIINLFMAASLNSFSSSSTYLPMVFLYFLSGLAAFVDKISFYTTEDYYCEKLISWGGFIMCLAHVCIYLAYSLGFIEINFHHTGKTYRVLMQGIENAFFTFNSIDITPFIFFSAFIIPLTYLAFCVLSYLREQGFNKAWIFTLFITHKIAPFIIFFSTTVSGLLGATYCWQKSCKSNSKFGEPQYEKYILLCSIIGLLISSLITLRHYKNKECSNTLNTKTKMT